MDTDTGLPRSISERIFRFRTTHGKQQGFTWPAGTTRLRGGDTEQAVEDLIQTVDRELLGEKHAELWLNGLNAAKELDTPLTVEQIAASLPNKSRQLYRRATSHQQEGGYA